MPALYSVYNWKTKQFDYYQALGNTPAPKRFIPMFGMSELGVTPDDVAIELPNNVQHVGSGEEAKGTMATKEKRGSGLFPWIVGGLIVALFIAPKFLNKD